MADLITLSRAKYNLANLTTSTAEDTTLAALISASSAAIAQFCGHDFSATVRDERYNGSPDRLLILQHYPVIEVRRVGSEPTVVLRIQNNSASNQRATVAILTTGLKLVRVASGTTTTDTTVTWSGNATLTSVANAVNALGNGWTAEVISPHGNRASADLIPDGAFHCQDRWAEISLHIEDVNDWSIDFERGWLTRTGGWSMQERRYRVVYQSGYSSIPEDVQEACAEWVAALFWQTKDNPAVAPTLPPDGVRRILISYRHRHL